MVCRVRKIPRYLDNIQNQCSDLHFYLPESVHGYHVLKITITECKLDRFPLIRETVLKIKHTILRTYT